MIEFKITLPHNDGMTTQDRLDFFDFIDEFLILIFFMLFLNNCINRIYEDK